MRHQKKTVKLGRTAEHRKALLANQVCSLIEHQRIKTTLAKAKAVRPRKRSGRRGDGSVENRTSRSNIQGPNPRSAFQRIEIRHVLKVDRLRACFGSKRLYLAQKPGFHRVLPKRCWQMLHRC